MKIIQKQFTEELALTMGTTESESKRYLDNFKQLIYTKLAEGNSIELSGFGKFEVCHRKPRTGYNLKTKLPITIPEFNTPKFRAGEAFKKAVAIK